MVLGLGVAITHNHEGLSFFDLIIEIPDSKLAMAAVASSRWQEILDYCSPHRPHPMMGLIRRLPDVAKTVLDHCRTQSTLDKQDPQFWVKYNFKVPQVGRTVGQRVSRLRDREGETRGRISDNEAV